MTIGERIKQMRESLDMSQEDLAKKMGYKSRNAIYKYESSSNMKLSMVEKFADALGCDPSYLMGWEDEHMKDLASCAYYNARISSIINQLDDSCRQQVLSYAEYVLSQHTNK